MILIEKTGTSLTPWAISFDGGVVHLGSRNDAIRYAAEVAAATWAREQCDVEILLREGGTTTQVGRFVGHPERGG